MIGKIGILSIIFIHCSLCFHTLNFNIMSKTKQSNWPSKKEGKKSGKGRDNNPPKQKPTQKNT